MRSSGSENHLFLRSRLERWSAPFWSLVLAFLCGMLVTLVLIGETSSPSTINDKRPNTNLHRLPKQQLASIVENPMSDQGSPNLQPRYEGPKEDELSSEQKQIRDEILASRKGTGLAGPFGPWLAVPQIAQPAQRLGQACRYGTSLSRRESELLILLIGVATQSTTEFDIHTGEAMRAGWSSEMIQAIPRDEDFSAASVQNQLKDYYQNPREAAIAQFAAELLETSTVSDETYYKTRKLVDGKDSVLMEIVAICGYYTLVSYTLNAFQIQP